MSEVQQKVAVNGRLGWFAGKTEQPSIQLFRSVLASFVSFSFDFAILAFLRLWLAQTLAAAIGFSLGTLAVFLLNTQWVFPRQRYKRFSVQLGVFFLFAATGSLLYTGLFHFFTIYLAWHFALAKPVSSGLVFFFNFITRKFFLYKKVLELPAGCVPSTQDATDL